LRTEKIVLLEERTHLTTHLENQRIGGKLKLSLAINHHHTSSRDDLGTCAIKNSIWSARMRRLRRMKSSHRLGT
jgi:hypothetical protein